MCLKSALLLLLNLSAGVTAVPSAIVINLESCKERLMKVSHELEQAGISFERLDAVNGLALTQDELEGNTTSLGRLFMTRGMIGCYMSHRLCWERCARSEGPLLIFEDDVTLTAGFAEELEAAMSDLPKGWDVLMVGALGCVHPGGVFASGLNMLPALVGGGWRKGERISARLHVPLRPFGMHAYVLTPTGANKLLKSSFLAGFHADVVALDPRIGLKLFSCDPLLAWQRHSDTTIGGLCHKWSLPAMVLDSYTRYEFGWAWCAPIMRLGPRGPLITNGRAIMLALVGLLASAIRRSLPIFLGTICYISSMVSFIRLLISTSIRT